MLRSTSLIASCRLLRKCEFNIGLFFAKVILHHKVKQLGKLTLTYNRLLGASLFCATFEVQLWYLRLFLESLEGDELTEAQATLEVVEAKLARSKEELEVEMDATRRQVAKLRQLLY